MATSDINLADRSGNLVESHKNYDPRIVFFYFIIAALLLTLLGGLAWQQLRKSDEYADAERQQNQRRVIFPGPRGNIYDRNGQVLVENRHRFSVLLHLDELKGELQREALRIYRNYRDAGPKKDIPTSSQLRQIARTTLVQRYLDEVNRIIGREEKVNVANLRRHFEQQLLLPYTLIENLAPEEYAKLIEGLPVRSPLEVYASNVRSYPFGSAAAHTLGYVRPDTEVEATDFPGAELTTFKLPGTVGMNGLEKTFNAQLQGEAGGRIYRVDPTGFKINKPLAERKPKQGKPLVTSLDIDLQVIAEDVLSPRSNPQEARTGAAVAIDVRTGEVLVLASKPDYDLGAFSPRATHEVVQQMNEQGAWTNHALNGFWPPGSTFKILSSIAALRAGTIKIDAPIIDCQGHMRLGRAVLPCENGLGHHGEVLLPEAITHSCDIYFYQVGLLTTPEVISAEGHRFRLDQRTGIELPSEDNRSILPDEKWRRRTKNEPWYPGDTAHMAIGQGDVVVTPLEMACFIASVARNETVTKPTLIHDANRAPQHSEPIGLTREQYAAIVQGMEGCVQTGTAAKMLGPRGPANVRLDGIRIAGKTGTAQKRVVINGKLGTINYAWFVCFAPAEKPEIAIAVAIEGDTLGETFEGGRNAAPVASAILKKYFEKKSNPDSRLTLPLKSE